MLSSLGPETQGDQKGKHPREAASRNIWRNIGSWYQLDRTLPLPIRAAGCHVSGHCTTGLCSPNRS